MDWCISFGANVYIIVYVYVRINMQIALIYNHITCKGSFCNINLFFPRLPKVQLRIKSQAPQPVTWQRKQWQGWTCRPKSPVQGEVTKSYATDLISSMTSWIWIPWFEKCYRLFLDACQVCERILYQIATISWILQDSLTILTSDATSPQCSFLTLEDSSQKIARHL